MKKEINKTFNFDLNIDCICNEGEDEEVAKRLANALKEELELWEGLFNTSILPWKKAYYFSVRNVEVGIKR